jgi:spore coat protein U-like protein
MRTVSTLVAVLAASFGFVQLASADDTDNLTVSANVAASCTVTGNNLGFGAYNTVSGAAVIGTATIAVACTTGTETTITLGEGENVDAGSLPEAPLRQMTDGIGNFLGYSLYSDTQRLVPWGDTVPTGMGYTALSSGSVNLTVFGRIRAGQDVPAGSYGDSVVATIAF